MSAAPKSDPAERSLVITIDTDTRENVDTKVFYDKFAEFGDTVKVLDKTEVCAWYAGLTEAHSATLKEQLDTRQEYSIDNELVAEAYAAKIAAVHAEIRAEREEEEEEEEEEPEKAQDGEEAAEGEAAAGEVAETAPAPTPADNPPAPSPAPPVEATAPEEPTEKFFMFLKGFPNTIEQCRSLQAAGVPLHVVINVNSLVPLAVPTEVKEEPSKKGGKKDPKGGKADAKKPDPKKGKDAKGGKKGKADEDDEPPAPSISLTEQLKTAVAELRSKHVQDSLRDILIIQHDMKTEKDEPEEEGGPPVYYLIESEDDVLDNVSLQINELESKRYQYDQWITKKMCTQIPTLQEFVKVEKMRKELKEREAEIAKMEETLAPPAAADGDKKGGKGKAGGKGRPETPADKGKKKDKATIEKEKEMEAQMLVLQGLINQRDALKAQILSRPPIHPGQLEVNREYYETLLEIVPEPLVNVPVLLHCMVEQTCKNIETERQVQTFDVPATAGTDGSEPSDAVSTVKVTAIESTATAPPAKGGDDIDLLPALNDYLDVVLARLDGRTDTVHQELVHKARKKEIDQASGMLDTAMVPPEDMSSEVETVKLVNHGDAITLQHVGVKEPLVAGVGAKALSTRMLSSLQGWDKFKLEKGTPKSARIEEVDEATEEPVATESEDPDEDVAPEIVQLGSHIRDYMSQAQIDRELILFELEKLFKNRRKINPTHENDLPIPKDVPIWDLPDNEPEIIDFEDRVFQETMSRSTFLQALSRIFLVDDPNIVTSWPESMDTGLCIIYQDVPDTLNKWRTLKEEFKGKVYFPEWLEWDALLEGRASAIPTPAENPASEDGPASDGVPSGDTLPEAANDLPPEDGDDLELDAMEDAGANAEKDKAEEAGSADKEQPVPEEELDELEIKRKRANRTFIKKQFENAVDEELYLIDWGEETAAHLHEETSLYYPCDGAVVNVTQSDINTKSVRCTVHQDDVVIGWRCSALRKVEVPPPMPSVEETTGIPEPSAQPETSNPEPSEAPAPTPGTQKGEEAPDEVLDSPPRTVSTAPAPYPYGETKPHKLYITANFADNSTCALTTELKFPEKTFLDSIAGIPAMDNAGKTEDGATEEGGDDHTEEELSQPRSPTREEDVKKDPPTLVTVLDYGCCNGLMVSQRTDGEIIMTYSPSLPDIQQHDVYSQYNVDPDADPGIEILAPLGDSSGSPKAKNLGAVTPSETSGRGKPKMDVPARSARGSIVSRMDGPTSTMTTPRTKDQSVGIVGIPPLMDIPKQPIHGANLQSLFLNGLKGPKDNDSNYGASELVHVWDADAGRPVQVLLKEMRRKIVGKGTVIKYLNDGTIQILFANGNVSTCSKGYWMVTNAEGKRTVQQVDRADVHQVPGLLCASNVEAETRAMVTTREDLVMVVHYFDGTRLAQHADGTRIWSDAKEKSFRIEARRLASVEITYNQKSVTTITRSTLVHVPDGTLLRYTSGEEFAVLRDDDNYLRADLKTHVLNFEPASIRSSDEGGQGIYQFDYVKGGLRVMDYEKNLFTVDIHGNSNAKLYDPVGANHPSLEPEESDMEQTLEDIWEVPRGTLSSIAPTTGWPAAMAAKDRVRRPEIPKKVAKTLTERDPETILANDLQVTMTGGAKLYKPDQVMRKANSHRPKIFLLNKDGGATELLGATDLLLYAKRAARDMEHTTIEQHPIAGQPHMSTVTFLTNYRLSDRRHNTMLQKLVPKSVATMHRRRMLAQEGLVKDSELVGVLSDTQFNDFMDNIASGSRLAEGETDQVKNYLVRSFLKYAYVDGSYRKAVQYMSKREKLIEQKKAEYSRMLQVTDDRAQSEKDQADSLKKELMTMIRMKERDAHVRDMHAQQQKTVEQMKAQEAAEKAKLKTTTNKSKDQLAEKKKALKAMEESGKSNYWNSQEGAAVHAKLPAYQPQTKTQPREKSSTGPVGMKAYYNPSKSDEAPSPEPQSATPKQYTPAPPEGSPLSQGSPDRSAARMSNTASSTQSKTIRDIHGNSRELKPKQMDMAAAEVNTKFQKREQGVARATKTASTATLSKSTSLSSVILEPIAETTEKLVATPSKLNFGQLCHGYVYGMEVTITNMGSLPSRFLVKPPKSEVHAKIHEIIGFNYNKGPIAPGMTVKITVTLNANGIPDLEEALTIASESTIITIPVSASFRPPSEGGRVSLKSGVRILSNAPLGPIKG